ncbi:SusD/RagB family nutrient-binding outer membrane lipoprotein [Chitinophaga qingshengii]|uniref:SusD/RagB family nutrient-binding outer membrane lipoprotein n=1 Tax=Chitinophaga qingshengii TaxID=1569794 RepID=A0ABR7TNW7_9BACT|nr:SusD/RagB family nutrient-binding outer membrane lipoprotein [Chitinophaga qingshengii]MBC9931258.1 SusD/RagB family nutrient-binding outer membrane lipoprotein [Chitinophaga qingshengii]
MTNKILTYSAALLLLAATAFTGCKKLDDINHDPTKPTTAEPQYLLAGAQKATMDLLYSGLQNGYIAMHYAQYWSANSRTDDSRYKLDEGNNSTMWNNLYRISLNNLETIVRQNSTKPATPELAVQTAVARVSSCWIYQILADAYGNVPYSSTFQLDAGNLKPAYDDAKGVYTHLLDTLQAQIGILEGNKGVVAKGDAIYQGSSEKWAKLAHSLMLRIAIRMADADGAKAKQIIEAHYQQAFSSNDDNAQLVYLNAAPNKFPFNDSEREIPDFFVSATMMDYMQSTNDPRLPIYARPSKDDKALKGMPYGWASADATRPSPGHFSYPGVQIYSATMPGILMNYAEVEFILAEAAARGMNVGEAATHYTNGIKASVDYWKKLTNSNGITDAMVDQFLAKVPYSAADWRNVIGTQKWLALYPQGFQGWFERTRLNFKKPGGQDLFIAPVSGSMDASAPFVPYRLTYLVTEQSQNQAAYNDAAKAIGGDQKGTKLWYNKF